MFYNIIMLKGSNNQIRNMIRLISGYDITGKPKRNAELKTSTTGFAIQVTWKQAKVVVRDPNTGELTLRYNEKGQSVSAGQLSWVATILF